MTARHATCKVEARVHAIWSPTATIESAQLFLPHNPQGSLPIPVHSVSKIRSASLIIVNFDSLTLSKTATYALPPLGSLNVQRGWLTCSALQLINCMHSAEQKWYWTGILGQRGLASASTSKRIICAVSNFAGGGCCQIVLQHA